MPVEYRASRDRRETEKHARAARPIETLAAAASKSARRHGSGSATKVPFKQKMPVPSGKSHTKHGTSRTTVHKNSKVESEHRREQRHRHRPREAEPDSEDDYVYPRETRERRKAPHVERQRYEEVKRLGRDGEEDEAEADARQDEQHARAERPRTSRTKSSHYHHHHQHHDHHRHEEERPRDNKIHRPRTEEEEREQDQRRRDRRAAREAEQARDLRHSSRARNEHRPEPVGLLSRLFGKRSKSVPPAPKGHRPVTKRNFSEPVLTSPRPEFRVPERDDNPRHHAPEKHKSERKKEKHGHTSILAGMFAPAVKEVAPVKPVKLVSCVACMDDDVKSTRAPKLKCGHRMCHSCLRRSFKLSIKDPQQMPPKCCTADQIPLHVVDKIFTNEWKKKWNRKYEEFSTKNRIYCPAKKCGEWIRPDDIKKAEGRKQGVCRKCKTKVCGTCNAKWHGAKDCPKDAETNALLETAREAGWQRCYSCRTLVELKEGCNHMTCRCTAEFCMLCGLKWRTCECPWFNYETVEADRLAHMRPINEEPLLGRPPLPPLFPRPPRPNANDPNLQNPFDAFFPPLPRPPQAHAPAMPQQPIDVFAAFGQMMNQQMNAQQQQAAERQRRREQHRQLLRAQQQLEERQRQLRADEELARNIDRLDLGNEQVERPRRRTRQASLAGSEAPASVQAGLGGPGRRRGSDRVDGWIQFVQPEVRAVPVR